MVQARRAHRKVTNSSRPPRRALSRSVGAIVAVVLVALAAAGCGSSSQGGSSGTLKVGYNLSPTSLNPARNGWEGITLNSLAYAPLIYLRNDGTLTPGLATSWGYVGTGNRTFRLTLRTDAHFADGTPVDAAAVKKWFDYFPTAQGTEASVLGPYISSTNVIDDHTVEIQLKSPTPDMDYLLSSFFNWGYVASPKALAHPATLDTATAGAGPYQLSSGATVTGDHYTYVPNPHYYAPDQVKFRSVVEKIIASSSTMLQAVKSGQLDVAHGDPGTIDAARSTGLDVVSVPATTAMLIFLDKAGAISKPLGDVRVRQALNYAIDRAAITKALVGANGTPTSQLLTVDGDDPTYDNYYSYDPAKARALLAAAGYPNGFTLDVSTNTFQGVAQQPTVQAMAKYLAAVGVKLRIRSNPNVGEFTKDFTSQRMPAIQWTAGTSSTWLFYGYDFKQNSLLNQHGWHDPVIDQLYTQALSASDTAPYWRKLMARSVQIATFLPVYKYDDAWYFNRDVKGVKMNLKQQTPLLVEWSK